MDGTAPHVVDPMLPGLKDELINLGQYWDRNKLTPHKDSIKRLKNKIGYHFNAAYSQLEKSSRNSTKPKLICINTKSMQKN